MLILWDRNGTTARAPSLWGNQPVIRKHGRLECGGIFLLLDLSLGISRGRLGGVTSSSQKSLPIVMGRRSEKAQNKPLFSRHWI
jgi:hypothetical protein